MQIDSIDHLVLTVADIATTCRWYREVLGLEPIQFGNGRWALAFGQYKFNLHQAGHEFEPKAARPTPGSADVCLITTVPLADVVAHFHRCAVPITEGPVGRTGAQGPIMSVYIRDPDQNLIEVATYATGAIGA